MSYESTWPNDRSPSRSAAPGPDSLQSTRSIEVAVDPLVPDGPADRLRPFRTNTPGCSLLVPHTLISILLATATATATAIRWCGTLIPVEMTVWLKPHETDTTTCDAKSATRCGRQQSDVDPSPSRQLAPRPQDHTELSSARTTVWLPPHATLMIRSSAPAGDCIGGTTVGSKMHSLVISGSCPSWPHVL